jgi:hypothetical protein
METERAPITIRQPEAMPAVVLKPAGVLKPTGKQVYALAHELCARAGVEFPGPCRLVGGGAASGLIQRLRTERARRSEM